MREGTDRYRLINSAKLVVWDEAPMMHRCAVNAVEKMFQRIKKNNKPMGGVTFVFMGDWRQTLPVVPLSSKEQKIAATLLFSYIWKNVEVLRLMENLRIKKHGGSEEWADYLLTVGEGKLGSKTINGRDYVIMPKGIVIESGKLSDMLA